MSDNTRNESSTYVIGSTDDVSEDTPLVTEVNGVEIAVFCRDSEYFALNNVCPHQGGPLGEGKIEDDCVYCPWHGWEFDLETGKHGQGIHDATTYPVTIEGTEIHVRL